MNFANKPFKTAFKILLWQLLLVAGLSIIMGFVKGIQSGWSTFLGGLAYWVPAFLFIWRVFAKPFARAARAFVVKFIAGEVVKLFLSGILFLLIVNYLPVQAVYVMVGFVGAIVAFWVSSLFLLTEQPGGV